MAHKSYSRVARVNHLVQEILAEEIELIDNNDLEMVTITGCEVTSDLRHAKVFISALGDTEKVEKGLQALEKNKGRLKRALSSSTRMKFLPDLHFLVDPSIEMGYKIESIIQDVHNHEGSLKIRDDEAFND
ncbi:MAG: 30S ribosome-binding factor RbfA [Acidimicrobiia bacterium]